jgi:signal transduction histidine kinase/HAMP domain-containing protein
MLSYINSLRVKLFLLVFLATLPATGLILYNTLEQRRMARAEAQENAVRLASLVSMEANRVITMTQQLLASLAKLPAVLNRNPEKCGPLLANLKETHPYCHLLLAAAPDGQVFCTSSGTAKPANLANRSYFQRALKTRDLAISDYIVGRLTRKPSIAFAQPAVDHEGKLRAVLVASLDLSWLIKGAPAARLPQDSVIDIIDSRGRVLARWPNEEQWIGRTLPETEIARKIFAGKEGVAEATGMEGIPRLYGFQPLLPERQAGFVYVGIPQKVAYGPANRMLLYNLIGLGVVIVLGFSASSVFAQVFILRGVDTLVETTEQLADGDLNARTGGAIPLKGEIGRLAAAFDGMAEALQLREKERKQAAEQIQRSAARSQLLSDISQEFIKTTSDQASVLHEVTRRAADWFGDACLIHLLKEEGSVLPGAVYYCEPENAATGHTPFSSPDPDSLALLSRVAETGHSTSVCGMESEEVSALLLERFQCESLLIVPMRADAQVIGALAVIRFRSDQPHTSEDESLLQHIADRAGNSVVRTRLVQTIRKINAELEERIKERTAQLVAANNELEAFAYSVSHDLRAPLRAIDGFGRILSEKYTNLLDPKGRDYLRRTRAAAQRMGQLIDDLLSLSRLTRKEMQWNEIDLSKMAKEITSELALTQPDRVVECFIRDHLVARGDERLLRAALENLLGNAWKFTGNQVNARIEFDALKQNGETVFFVRDNGAGFDMRYADQLFGAFQRLHSMSEFPGTGIGLAIVQRVIRRHGGSVWAEGTVDRGATFYFKFPKESNFYG